MYEPGSILGKSWPDVVSFGQEAERNTEFLQKVISHCLVSRFNRPRKALLDGRVLVVE